MSNQTKTIAANISQFKKVANSMGVCINNQPGADMTVINRGCGVFDMTEGDYSKLNEIIDQLNANGFSAAKY